MQAQKQSTGDISRCHSGAAKKKSGMWRRVVGKYSHDGHGVTYHKLSVLRNVALLINSQKSGSK